MTRTLKDAAAPPAETALAEDSAARPTFAERAGSLFGTVRGHPKTAIAAGAAIAAAGAAAAAIPLARRARANRGNGKDEGGTTLAAKTPARRRTTAKKKG